MLPAPPEEAESIFSPPEDAGDALFGPSAPPLPELPAEPCGPHASDALLGTETPASGTVPSAAPQSSPAAYVASGGLEAAFQGTVSPVAPASPADPVHPPNEGAPAADELAFLTASAAPAGGGSELEAADLEPFAAVPARRPVPAGLRSGVFIALVLVPLLSWAILATIAVIVLLLRPPPPDPLERLPDVEGDFHGARRQKPLSYERVKPDAPLPAKLRVGLGQALRVGDVEVAPEQVELRRIAFRRPGRPPEPAGDDSLVLRLRLRNVAPDVQFSPTDPFFDRQWNGQASSGEPYTFLELGGRRFFGGALPWRAGVPPQQRTRVLGQCYQVLQPGEELHTLVCTDPEDHVARYLDGYHGSLLWRVQVRRGLVRVGSRDVSATAVVGVAFPATAIRRPPT